MNKVLFVRQLLMPEMRVTRVPRDSTVADTGLQKQNVTTQIVWTRHIMISTYVSTYTFYNIVLVILAQHL